MSANVDQCWEKKNVAMDSANMLLSRWAKVLHRRWLEAGYGPVGHIWMSKLLDEFQTSRMAWLVVDAVGSSEKVPRFRSWADGRSEQPVNMAASTI